MIINERENNLELSVGFQEYIIDIDTDVVLNINATRASQVLLRVKKANTVNINSVVKDGSNTTLLVLNESDSFINFIENHIVNENSNLNIAYGDLNGADLKRNCKIDLVGKGATTLLKSATLCKNKKHYTLEACSKVPYTKANIENYSVVLTNGNYKMDATGRIDRGAYKSESHQTSRALAFSEKQISTIIPNLMIDENDVMASHATSLGRVDENQMVYMQSRGLTVNQVMQLISTGYLLPIADFIDNEDLRNTLRNDIESMVSKECSM